MNTSRLPLYLLLALLVAILSLPFTFPFGLFIPDFEKKAGELLQAQVSISKISFRLTTSPALILEHVVINNKDDAEIGELAIPFKLSNLIHWGRELRIVEMHNARLSRSFALSLPSRIHPGEEGLHIRKLEIHQSAIALEKTTVGPFDSILSFKPDGQIEDLVLADPNGRADLKIRPNGNGHFGLEMTARGWDLPLGYPVKFEYLSILADATVDGMDITDLRADLYNGLITGKARLDWKDKWILAGDVVGKNIQAEPLIKLFSATTYSSGRMNADASFHYEADAYKDLFSAPQLQGNFAIADGQLHNFDLISPLKSQMPDVVRRGGQTEFANFTGKFSYQSGNEIRFTGLNLNNGKYKARGEVRAKDGAIAGMVFSQINSGPMSVSAALAIAGRIDAPELRSGGAARSRPVLPGEVETPAVQP